MNHNNISTDTPTTSICAVFLRLFWLFIGIMALAICAMFIAKDHDRSVSGVDAVYGLLIPLLILSRYLDVRFYKGDTAYGLPATMADWRHYSLYLTGFSLLGWLAAHGIAFLLAS